ncbi:MAG: PepSY domain-containing protein [Clostridia bacterium]|nr:PepSY domain-containing protein [Clostridia bacterium]
MEPVEIKARGRSSKAYKWFKKYHKWFGIVLAVFVLLFASSGIILNHRSLLSSIDIDRSWLPRQYQYRNWNMAAVRGSIDLQNDTLLVYGNIGVWKVTDDLKTWIDFNQGFPQGIDQRKISKLLFMEDGTLVAGTLFGLYTFADGQWQYQQLPVEEERITDLFVQQGQLMVLTRSRLFQFYPNNNSSSFREIVLQPSTDDDGKVSLFRTLWSIHGGKIFGEAGRIVVDLLGLALIFLTVSGLLLWLFPGIIRRYREQRQVVKPAARLMRFSLRWHNRLGYYLLVFLIITTLTGIFLRPPLLIAIAEARIPKIPATGLDTPNPWDDKLRAGIYDVINHRVILSTSEGFYYANADFAGSLQPFAMQPPVSVMGINVLENLAGGGLLTGSFSGLYAWYPQQQYVENMIARREYQPLPTTGRPFSDNAVAGLVRDTHGHAFIFDYDRGATPWQHGSSFPAMPQNVVDASPISLWNLALEVHTARIYAPLIGDFYILVVPLIGLSLLFLLFSGWWMYRKGFKRRKS